LLWGEAMEKGYTSSIWMTYKQAAELNAQVRKGEHGALVVYADRFTRIEADDHGEDVEREIPFMKGYTVFNVEQVDGLPSHYYAQPANPLPLSERIENADRFMTNTAATVNYNSQASVNVGDAVYSGPFFTTWTNVMAGDNVIAVEVHQNGTNSSDVVFGAEFTIGSASARQSPCDVDPPLSITRQGTNVLVLWQGNGFRLEKRPDLAPSTLWIPTTNQSPLIVPQSETNFSGTGLTYKFVRDGQGVATAVFEGHISGDYKFDRQK